MASLIRIKQFIKRAGSILFARQTLPEEGMEAVWKLDDCITYIFPNAKHRPDWMNQVSPERALAVAREKFGTVTAGWEHLLETNLLQSDVEYRRVEEGEPQLPGDIVVGVCPLKGDHIAKVGDNHLPIGRTEYGYEVVMFATISSTWRAK